MNNAALLVTLLLGLVDRANTIGILIATAQKEGRDVTDAELDKLAADDDEASIALQNKIDKARGK